MASKGELIEHARDAVPAHYARAEREQEELHSGAEVLVLAAGQVEDWVRSTYILDAEGKWLDEHARDRGLRRQEGESDAALRERIRHPEDAVTRPALKKAVEDIVGEEVAVLEMRRDRAFFGSFESRAGTGGTFEALDSERVRFIPEAPPPGPVEVNYPRSGAQGNPRIFIFGADDDDNNGTFEIQALDGNGVVYANPDAVSGEDDGVVWEVRKHDVAGNNREGRARAYLSRGYRVGGRHPHLIVILPEGATEGTRESVRDALRAKAAAGVKRTVEVRQS